MRKKIIIILIVFLITGCTTNNITNTSEIDRVLDSILGNNTKLINTSLAGYKYYLPNDMRIIDSNDYNDILSYNGYNFYLNVNLVNYYYKDISEVIINNDDYYFKELNYNDKNGYISIKKNRNLYTIKMYYNYATIETCVDHNNLKQAVINSSYILNSMTVNDKLIENKFDTQNIDLNSESFDFYKPKNESNFINYVNQYVEYKEKEDNSIGKESE